MLMLYQNHHENCITSPFAMQQHTHTPKDQWLYPADMAYVPTFKKVLPMDHTNVPLANRYTLYNPSKPASIHNRMPMRPRTWDQHIRSDNIGQKVARRQMAMPSRIPHEHVNAREALRNYMSHLDTERFQPNEYMVPVHAHKNVQNDRRPPPPVKYQSGLAFRSSI